MSSEPEPVGSGMAALSATTAAATAIVVLAIGLLGPGRLGVVTVRPTAPTAASESLATGRTEPPAVARTPVARRSGASDVEHRSGACPVPTARELRLTLSATSAASGDRLTALAALGVVAEDGAAIGPRMDRVDIWWDLDFDRWWSALIGKPAAIGGGHSRRVASVATRSACTFSASFGVPEAKPGSHDVVAIAFDARDGGATAYAPAHVTVR